MKHKGVPFLLIIFVGLATTQCLPDIGGSGAEPPPPRILDIKIHPNDTVTTTDTVTITCIIEDSLEMDNYEFLWVKDEGKFINGELVSRDPNLTYKTLNNKIRWTSEAGSKGRLKFTVLVGRKFPSSTVREGFKVYVKNN